MGWVSGLVDSKIIEKHASPSQETGAGNHANKAGFKIAVLDFDQFLIVGIQGHGFTHTVHAHTVDSLAGLDHARDCGAGLQEFKLTIDTFSNAKSAITPDHQRVIVIAIIVAGN